VVIARLLDTCICIDLLRHRNRDAILHHLRKYEPETIAISAITYAELMVGIEKRPEATRKRAAFHAFCTPLHIAVFDEAAGAYYAHIRARLERGGNPIGPMDTLIAGHALALNTPLVTSNAGEFERVPGLIVEYWTR